MARTSHEDYSASQPPPIRKLLEQVRKAVEAQVPRATRTIGYNMPAFKQARIFMYFAAFKKHIGIYPPVTGDGALIEETRAFRGPRGNLSFPYGQELPLALIGRVAAALAAQYAER
jgi:uncharacterized protein YdhG (YjbR/CyaY superfamily)